MKHRLLILLLYVIIVIWAALLPFTIIYWLFTGVFLPHKAMDTIEEIKKYQNLKK